MKKIFLILFAAFLWSCLYAAPEDESTKPHRQQSFRRKKREVRDDAQYLIDRRYEQEETIEKQISAILDKNEIKYVGLIYENARNGGDGRTVVERPPSRYKIREQFENLCIYGFTPLIDHLAKLEFVGILCDMRKDIPPEELTRHLTRLWKSLRQDTIISEVEAQEYISKFDSGNIAPSYERMKEYNRQCLLLKRKQKMWNIDPIREALFHDTVYVFFKNYPEDLAVLFNFFTETGYMEDLIAADKPKHVLSRWIMDECPVQYFIRAVEYWWENKSSFGENL